VNYANRLRKWHLRPIIGRAKKEFCWRFSAYAACISKVRSRHLIVCNYHFVCIESLQNEIDMVGAMIGFGTARGSHITRFLLSNRDSLPFSFQFKRIAKDYGLIRISDSNPRLL